MKYLANHLTKQVPVPLGIGTWGRYVHEYMVELDSFPMFGHVEEAAWSQYWS